MLDWKRIPPLVRIPLVYGILGSVLSLGFVIAFFYYGKHPFFINPVFDIRIVLSAILLFFAIREVRDYFFGGIIFFWQAMGGCLVYFATLAVVCALGLWALGSYDPDFVNLYQEQGLQQIQSYSPEVIEQIGKAAVDELKETLPQATLGQMIRKYTGQTLIIAFFVTIIISVISRRQPKN